MTELTCIKLLERVIRNGGVMTIQDFNDALPILKAHGSELMRDYEDPAATWMNELKYKQ